MANAEKAMPSTKIELAGNHYKLHFDFEAFCLLEEMTGINALDGEVWEKPSASTLSTLLWAAMQRHHPELSVKDVRKKISFGDMPKLSEALVEAFEKASPPSEDKEAKNS